MKKTIFISFSLGNTSISDYYVSLAEKFKQDYQIVVFSDVKLNETISISEDIIIKYWPSKRPTKFADGIFLYENIKKYRPIMTISVFGSVNIFLIVGFLCRVKFRVAWISTISTHFRQKKSLLYRKSFAYRLATTIVTNSKATKEDAIKNYYVCESKIKVLPNSVKDLYSTINEDEKENYKTIVYVGRLYSQKGVDVLIKAFSMVCPQFPDFKLIILGGGQEEKKLKKLVDDLKIGQRVIFKGNQPKVKVLETFKNSYLAVVPSLSEGFGFTVIEAMSMKTMVIGSNNTGIKEIIQDNKTGFLFETSNEHDLAEKIIKSIKQPALRDELALNGFKHFQKNYETDFAVERDWSFFNSLIR
ncbi:glycosyltransferase [Flavobacterium sp. LHD-85]|uniref:glycosyltransferase n=1 Tax=Flavobacterium sp. LHD-85 TaxID=3071410 RepID=UPI0027E171E0|nr:glycosyltransferase [Flavobacterium sp. LHD-85]MDQ6529637.1 glycosyltransferase [Flavobacterium sp. LHD-85]